MSQKKTYEGMFLLDPGNADFQAASQPVRNVLTRNEAEILVIKPWDERRLAYEVQGHRRGLYVLTYFQVDPAHIAEIDRDCQLSEQILRSLILRREHLSDEQIHAETPVTSAAGRGREGEEAHREGSKEAPVPPAAADEEHEAEPSDAEGEENDKEAETA
jgi:small subunit ribosomal protein S6